MSCASSPAVKAISIGQKSMVAAVSSAEARHVFDGVGHFPTREAPDAVNMLLTAFLAR